MAAFVAFAGGLQCHNDAVVDQQLHLTFGDFAQTSVRAEGTIRTAAARPLGDRTVRHLPRKGEGARHGTGQTQTLKRSGRQERCQQLIGADRFTPARHLQNRRFRTYGVDMRHLPTEFIKALNKLTVRAVPGHGRTERASPRPRIRFGQVRVLHRQDAGASTQVGGHPREVAPGELRGNCFTPPHRAFARGLPAQAVHEQQKKDEHRCVSFAAGFSTTVGDSKHRGRCSVERLFNSKTRLPKVPSADEFLWCH